VFSAKYYLSLIDFITLCSTNRKWHFIEFICIVLVFAYSIVVIAQDYQDQSYIVMTNSGKGNVPLAVVTTLFLTAKFVSMLRGFEVTGYLVAFLLQSFLDVRGFVIVIISILMGFTVAFRLLLAQVPGECKVMIEDENVLSNDCDSDPFGNLSRSVLSTFELTILGSYENGILYDAKETFLVSAVFVIAVTVILVIALNALIAVLGDSFSRVQENVSATRQRERAELVVEYLSMMPIRHRKRIENNNQFFHALLDSDGHGDLLKHRDDWQGGFNALKRELTEITEANNVMTQRAIDQLRREMTDEISSMLQNEVTSVLNNVFIELKEIGKFRQTSMRTRKVANAAHAAQAMGSNTSTLFDVIRRNINSTDDRSAASLDLSEDNNPNTLISF
jgi:flagellar basal body-associated protein FliL